MSDIAILRQQFCKAARHAPPNVFISVYAYRAGHCVWPEY